MPGTDLNIIYSVIEALMVIHNILIDLGDDPTLIENYNGVDELVGAPEVVEQRNREAQEINNFGSVDLYRTGLLRRKELMNLVD